jgi:hypothetical protein
MVLDDLTAHDRFVGLLEWMLALEKRHAEVLEPGLVYVQYNPEDVRELTFDASDAAHKLSAILTCLRSAFRGTDLITRIGTDFWILVPFTQIDPVIEKVQKVLRSTAAGDLGIAHSNVHIYPLRDHMAGGAAHMQSASDFLGYLMSLPKAAT